ASAASQLNNLPHLRDYAKAPYLVITLLVLGYVVTRPLSRRALTSWCAAIGAWIGIGFGIRFDVGPYLAFFVVAMVIFRSGSLRAEWPVRLTAGAVACASFLVVASPILRSFELGNNSWHVVLLGLSARHDGGLGVEQSVYDSGPLYNDSYVTA